MTASPPSVEGRRLFTFAVVSDTHVNESEDRSPSPFRTNLLANGRARFVVHEIAAMDPPVAFVVHLGDMVHPVPSQSTYQEAVARYRAIVQVIKVPVHQIPGNHDIGDKALDWMPADIITDDFLAAYRLAFGADRFAFEHGPIHCIGINSVLINSGLAEEGVQRDWLEAELAKHRGQRAVPVQPLSAVRLLHRKRRTVTITSTSRAARGCSTSCAITAWRPSSRAMCTIFGMTAPATPSSTFSPPPPSSATTTASWLGSRLRTSSVATTRPNLATRSSYVHERGHVMRLIRTDGTSLAPDARFELCCLVPAPNPRTLAIDNIGVELRHPWAEVVEVPATGGVQEFGRSSHATTTSCRHCGRLEHACSRYRNRTSLHPVTRATHEAAAQHRASLYHDLAWRARAGFRRCPSRVPDLVDAIEVNLELGAACARCRSAAGAQARRPAGRLTGLELRMREDARYDGGKFSHFVKERAGARRAC